jgi:hypothetical protein
VPVSKKLKTTGLVIFSYLGFVVLIAYCALAEIISLQQAGLMLVAEFGLYIGFGILIAVYRLINKLE